VDRVKGKNYGKKIYCRFRWWDTKY
jgi:hypothetical protein